MQESSRFFVIFSFQLFLLFFCGLNAASSDNSTASSNTTSVSSNVTDESSSLGIAQNTTDDVSKRNDSSANINETVLNGTNVIANITPSEDGNVAAGSKIVEGPECVINRGWFWRKLHLQTGHSYFSPPDCALQVCNEKGGLDFYSCNRLDAWDVLRPNIDREVNEGQLQCLKTGCI